MYFKFCIISLLCCVSGSFSDEIIDKVSNIEWLCADENCTVPISIGNPKMHYQGDHDVKVGFNTWDIINVHGKPADKKEELWLVSVGEKVGVAPKELIKEKKILVNADKFTRTKFDFGTHLPASNGDQTLQKPDINPSPPQEVVIDGTTLSVHESYEEAAAKVVEKSSEVAGKVEPIKEEREKSPSTEGEEIVPNKNLIDSTNDPGIVLLGSVSETQYLDEISNTTTESSIPVPEKISENANHDTFQTEKKVPSIAVSVENTSEEKAESDSKTLNGPEDTPPTYEPEPPSSSETEKEDNLPSSDIKNKQIDTDNIPSDINSIENDRTTKEEFEFNKTDNTVNSKENLLKSSKSITESSLPNSYNTESITESSLPNSYTTESSLPNSYNTESITESSLPNSYTTESTVSVNSSESIIESSLINSYTAESTVLANSSESIIESSLPNSYTTKSTVLANFSESIIESSLPNSYTTKSTVSVNSSESIIESSLPNSYSTKSTVSATPEKVMEVKKTDSVNNIPPYLPFKNNVQYPGLSNPYPGLPTDSHNTEYAKTVQSESQNIATPDIDNHQSNSGSNDNTYTPGQTFTQPPILLKDKISGIEPSTESSDSNFVGESEGGLGETHTPDVLDVMPDPEPLGATSPETADISPSSGSPEVSPAPEILETIPQMPSETPGEYPSSTETYAYENLPDIPPAESSLESEDNLDDADKDWFSPISSVIKSFKEMFSNSDIGIDDSQTINEFTTESYNSFQSSSEKAAVYEDSNQSCEKGGICGTFLDIPEVSDSYSIPGFDQANVSGPTLIYVTVTSAIVLIFSLGYYYLDNMKRDTELIGKINSLSAELFFAQKELSTMEEQISTTSDDFQKLASNTTVNEEELNKLKQDLEGNKAVNKLQEAEIKRMVKEIEELVESNDEMHKMLTESITEEDRTQSLLGSIADLKGVLSERLEEIAAITDQLDKEKQEVELLTIALQKTEEQKEHIEEKLQKVQNEIDSKALAVAKEFEEKVTSLERIIDESSLDRTNFEKELCELKAECEKLSAEKELSEKALKKAQGIGPGKALAEWLDTKEVRVELISAQKKVEKLRRQIEEAKEHEAKLLEQKTEMQLEIEALNSNYETAEKTKIETLTKLQVLSNYFKEKETQMHEELGDRESQWLQKQSEDHTIYEQMRSLREENLSYKAQNEALKKEILDQEASFKIQMANEEQKSQENWVTLRHAERRLKESQMESAHLRSRLTVIETNSESLDEKHKSMELVNGVGPGSPPFMLYPPPPDFIPLPPLVSPSRPPPLGRLSSPPLTPPPPLSPYDLYPPPPGAPSPPTLRDVHKPLPRDPGALRKQKESQSSNHSSESMEKPLRRGKR